MNSIVHYIKDDLNTIFNFLVLADVAVDDPPI